jgi:hypothetical protein
LNGIISLIIYTDDEQTFLSRTVRDDEHPSDCGCGCGPANTSKNKGTNNIEGILYSKVFWFIVIG